jgi:riboflavin kinase/FMN adenylyltransferase
MIILEGPWEGWSDLSGSTSVTIGVLDGLHLGHRALLDRLDPGSTRTVLTFDPHPVEVLRPGTQPRLITTIDERLVLLDQAGVDCVGVLDLAEIREQSPEEFVTRVLVEKLHVTHVVVGEDFRFGKDRTGDVALLTRMGGDIGFVVESIPLVTTNGAPVSSSRIRELIESGEVVTANRLLGSRFGLSNEVVAGEKRGRDLGFPTANLRPPERKVIPGIGVYSCFATVDGMVHDAAVNVGVRPTFGAGELLIEAFLIDFDDDLYGNEMTLRFVQYLRPELEFTAIDDLVNQMADDVAETRKVLAEARSGI